jgi:hypothetical protein
MKKLDNPERLQGVRGCGKLINHEHGATICIPLGLVYSELN